MTIKFAAALAAFTLAAAPALAQAPAPAAAPAVAPAGALSVQTTPINEIIKNPKAKAAIEEALPMIANFYPMVGERTLAEIAPMSQGALDEAKLKELQAKFDAISAGK